MRRTRTKTRHPRHRSHSFSDDEMMGRGLFASSSASSSSNLSPLAPPFTVERSNHSKFNLSSNLDSHFNGISDGVAFWSPSLNFQSSTTTQDLLADSIRTATVPSTYSTFPNPITTPSTHNWSSNPAANLSAISPNSRVIDASFSTLPNLINSPSNDNWSSMNSSIKSGLEPINPPAGHLFGINPRNPNTQPLTWSFGDGDSEDDDDAPMMPLNFNLLPSSSLFHDYGSSNVDYSQSLSGSKYSGQSGGSQGKVHSTMFGGVSGGPVTRENNIGPSIIGNSYGTSPSATYHGPVSSGFSKEQTFTWNGHTSRHPFETRSVLYDSSSDHISPLITTKSLEISSASLFNKKNVSVSHNPLKEKESHCPVGFEYKSSSNFQVPEVSSTEDANLHNPGEDSPCWKGAPTNFSSCGSQEPESSQHPMKIQSFDENMDKSMHGTVENVVTVESSDVNVVVKALNNLSELLLIHCSKDEYGLKEQDRKALDNVIANLNVCMYRKIRQVGPTQKYTSPQHITSTELHEEWNNDNFGKNIEELQSASLRDEYLPKDYNMVQKIKMVLDENLECKEDIPSSNLLYKNLWLEAEAELCVSSYRNRFNRAKREMVPDVSEVASEIKKISSSNISPKLLQHGSKTSNTHAHSISLASVDDHIENSVMTRFNILKHREESNTVDMAEKEPAPDSGNEIQSSGVAEEPHLEHHFGADDALLMHSHGNQKLQDLVATEDVDHAILARFNILKSRDEPNQANVEQRVLADGVHAQVSGKESLSCGTTVEPHFQLQAHKEEEVGLLDRVMGA